MPSLDTAESPTVERFRRAPEPSRTVSAAPQPDPAAGGRLALWLRRLSEARGFQLASTGVILFNAVLIGAETYKPIYQDFGPELVGLDMACVAFFIAEIVIRMGGYGRRPWRFFGNGWNVFDFIVVAAAFIPGLRENITVLRLFRLARIVRIVRSFSQLRILLSAVWRSMPGTIGLIGISGIVLYLYGMVGWILFGEALPEQYGSIGSAVLTLFMLMTMDEVATTVRHGIEITDWAIPYYLSFVMLGGFVLINLLIGVVITSMEEARNIEKGEAAQAKAVPLPVQATEHVDTAEILVRLDVLQRTVMELKRQQATADTPPVKTRKRKRKR